MLSLDAILDGLTEAQMDLVIGNVQAGGGNNCGSERNSCGSHRSRCNYGSRSNRCGSRSYSRCD